MTIAQALARAVQTLKAANLPDAAIDARVLLAYALGIDRGRLTLGLPDLMPEKAKEKFDLAISQRLKRKPVSKIIGKRAFYGREFTVSPDVLDPRPDTELLVDIALGQAFATVLDLGTGSGCILLTLLAERPSAQGLGSDVSAKALCVAQTNARTLCCDNRATFMQSDWFANIAQQKFDLIVSNPPYISQSEMFELEKDVRVWEPEIALTPGGDGLEAYRILTRHAPKFLTGNGRLIVEIGHMQGQAVAGLFESAGFGAVQIAKDLNAKDRVVSGIWPKR